MSERKVLNKYYPPDFDPSKIPRMKLPKNRQYTVRLMAPFNMRCATCGEYIYKGKKFNARKEDVEDEDYLGIRIYRFYIKCTRCLQEISFRTDPKSTDYEIEAGATRNFMALKKAEEQAKREEEEEKEADANNPMKMLENRTEQSKQEMELVEALEELRELNVRQGNVDFDQMLNKYNDEDRKLLVQALQDKEDDKVIKQIFGPKKRVVEIIEEVSDEEEGSSVASKRVKLEPNSEPSMKTFQVPSPVETVTFSMKPKPLQSSSLAPSSSTTTTSFRQNISSFIKKKDPPPPSAPIVKPDAKTDNPKTGTSDPEADSKSGLSLLGAYSSSEGSSGDET
uniref:Splicing factor YJU2 n=1 Tax=Cacopsylla melanoneura TaxID=428564 RepID=A0A8D8WHY3_9HEMI